MTDDRPMLGIALMMGFCILAPLGDSIAKLLGGEIPVIELLIVRFAMQVLLLAPAVRWYKHSITMTKRVFYLILIRTVLHIIAGGAMFSALLFLPLADAVAITFVLPFIMLILGRYFLNEEVGARRIIACAVGFCGTLLVVQPSFEVIGAPALLPLLVAVAFAFFMLVTRQIAKEIDPTVLQVVSGVQAVIILGLIFLFAKNSNFDAIDFKIPNAFDGLLLFILGIIGTLAHLLMAWSLRFAPSTTLAPMQYLEIPFATLIGWFIFKDLPNGLAALGIFITMAAGLYIVWRERVAANNVS